MIINRVLSRWGLFEVLKVSLLLAAGLTVEETAIIYAAYSAGCICYNPISIKLGLTVRTQLLIVCVVRAMAFLGLLLIRDLNILTILSFAHGFVDMANFINSELLMLAVSKDEYVKSMQKIAGYTSLSIVVVNFLPAKIVVLLLIAAQGIVAYGLLKLKEAPASRSNTIARSDVGTTEKTDNRQNLLGGITAIKTIPMMMLVYISYRVYFLLVSRTKPYYLTSLEYNGIVLRILEAVLILSPLIIAFIPQKYKTIKMVPLSLVCLVVVTLLSIKTKSIILYPYLIIATIALQSITPIITQKLNAEESEQTVRATLNLGEFLGHFSCMLLFSMIASGGNGLLVTLPVGLIALGVYHKSQIENNRLFVEPVKE